MKNRNSSYWQARSKAIMDKQQGNADIANQKLMNVYEKAIAEINHEIRTIYNKLKTNGELDDAKVMRLLNKETSSMERAALKKLRDSTKDPKLRKYLTARLDAPAYAARIARRESLKINLREDLLKRIDGLAKEELKIDTSLYIRNINDAYYSHMYEFQKGVGIGFDVGTLGTSTVESILKQPFAGANYSQRVWNNTNKLSDQLYETMLSGLLNGKPLKVMVDELTDNMGMGKNAARRLIKTESAYYTNMGAIEGYKECGIEQYRYFAKLDLKVSDVCKDLDGKIFPRDKAQAGENLPPMHPWCRSSIGPVIEGVAQRIGARTRDPVTGASYTIPGDITYKEWYDKYVVGAYGKDQAELLEKKIKNKGRDQLQYSKYKDTLGKDAPKSFDKFQNIKYNGGKEWEETKGLYKYIKDNPSSNKTYYDINKDINKLKNDGIVNKDIGIAVKPQVTDYDNIHKHALKRMRQRGISEADINTYIDSARIMFKQNSGAKNVYYSNKGSCSVVNEDKTVVTVFSSEYFDDGAKKIMEVLDQYGV